MTTADGYEFRFRPAPTDDDRRAVLKAVEELLRREEQLARPSVWTVSGWTHKRTGITDLGPRIAPNRVWALSARLAWGGREHPGLIGRGDAK